MVVKVVKTKNFTVMSNHHLTNRRLSLKAIGLMSIVLSLPDDWGYSIGGLRSLTGESEASIKKVLAELKNEGYLHVRKVMPSETKTGRIEYEYTFYEIPQAENKGCISTPLNSTPLNSTPLNSTPLKDTPLINTKDQELKIQKTKDTKDIVAFLNSELGTRYKAESKELREMISGRLTEGYTVEDFKTVIRNMKEEWGNDERMSKYLRPSTLFAPTHFPEYLNRKPQQKTGGYFGEDDLIEF